MIITNIFNQVRRLGTFLRGIIQPNRTIQEALQDLENYCFYLPTALTPKGTWNATTNIPALASGGVGSLVGDYYVVSVAGNTILNGHGSWDIGDHLFLGSDNLWHKVDNAQLVSSVFGRAGAVVAAASDYDAVQIDFNPVADLPSTEVQSAISALNTRSKNLSTLSGVALNAVNFGTFTGDTLSNDKNSKELFQEIEIALEAIDAATPLVDITYADLVIAISGSTLIPGQNYKLTDFQTVHTIYGTASLNTGPVEPLIFTATSVNAISNICRSVTYPNDIIIYNVTNTTEMPGATKGFIRRRIDMLKNIDICYDFRAVKFRRYEVTQPAYIALTSYSINQVVVDAANTVGAGANKLYISCADSNVGQSLNDKNSWLPFEGTVFVNGGYWGLNSATTTSLNGSGGVITRPANITTSANYQDFYLFGDLANTSNVSIYPGSGISLFTNRNSFFVYSVNDFKLTSGYFNGSVIRTAANVDNASFFYVNVGQLSNVKDVIMSRFYSHRLTDVDTMNLSNSILILVDNCYSMFKGSFISNYTTYSVSYNQFLIGSSLVFSASFATVGSLPLQYNKWSASPLLSEVSNAVLFEATTAEIYKNGAGVVKVEYRDSSDAVVTEVLA